MEAKHVVIQTKLGQLRGHTKQSILTKQTYYAFQGIPFGKPPLGELRFKAPQPFGSWTGIRDALEDGPVPKQFIMLPRPGIDPENPWEGDEDCLYLNIYMNELPHEGRPKKPVMFSIHGGGFNAGSGTFASSGPDVLLYGDVIIVSPNYRVGAFGFLSLENEEVPGNAGLKDQVLALKWVHDNIDSFGGDPNNVTIFGISAGGASVSYQLLSPSSRGLFQKAIIQSGFSLNPWTLQENPRAKAAKLAENLGCKSEDPNEILRVLQSATANEILKANRAITTDKDLVRRINLIFTPCVEIPGTDSFLVSSPDSVMKKGEFSKVPVILGCCVKEGSLLGFIGLNEKKFAIINNNPDTIVPPFLGLKSGSVEEKEAQEEIWNYYFKGNPVSWDNVDEYLKCQGDIHFLFGMEQTRKYLLEKSPEAVYSYLFTNHTKCLCESVKFIYQDENQLSKIITSETCHGADAAFIYTINSGLISTTELTSADKEAMIKQAKAWTKFASTGDPNCSELRETWEKNSTDRPCFMDIGTSWKFNEGIPLADRIGFWERLYSKYHNE